MLALLAAPPAALGAQAVTEVQVVPDAMALAVGERRPLLATLFDRSGQVVTGVTPVFTSTDTAVVSVTPRGVVTAVGPGLAAVDVRVGERAASVAISVRGAPLPAGIEEATRLVANHPTLLLLPGEEASLAAAALRADGSVVGTVTARWESADPAVASVRAALVRGAAEGSTTVTGRAAGMEVTVPVTVARGAFAFARTSASLAPGQRDTLRVVVPSQGGRTVESGLTWASSDTTVLELTPTGAARGVAPGRAEAIVRGFGQEGRLPLVVHPRVEAVVAEPGPSSGPLVAPLGAAVPVRVRAEAADGRPVADAIVHWQVRDSSVARFAPGTGMLHGLRAGTTELSARLHGFAPLTWTVRVVPGTLALVPARAGAAPGDTVAIEAMLLDEAGTAFATPRDTRWRVADAAVADLTDDGLLVARSRGRTALSVATPWGATATGEVLVSDRLLAATAGTGGGIVGGPADDPAALHPMVLGPGPNAQPVRSPDGTRLAWTSARDGDVEVYVSDADGRETRRLTTSPGYDAEAAWLPGGDAVVFVSARAGTRRLWVASLDGSPARPLGAPEGPERRAPAVSPDGGTVAALTGTGGEADLMLVEVASGSERLLPATPEAERAVRWLDDGTLLVARDRGDGTALLLVNPADGAARLRLETSGRFVALAASPDGERAALLVARDGGQVLLLVPVAGGPPREVPVPAGTTLQELDLR